jgi:hypothetical protein
MYLSIRSFTHIKKYKPLLREATSSISDFYQLAGIFVQYSTTKEACSTSMKKCPDKFTEAIHKGERSINEKQAKAFSECQTDQWTSATNVLVLLQKHVCSMRCIPLISLSRYLNENAHQSPCRRSYYTCKEKTKLC